MQHHLQHDGFYLQHIVEFLTNSNCDRLQLYTDNSAVRMLSLKCGVGGLRHIKGRMLWLQGKMANGELEIKQVQTAWNVADLNTKGLSHDRFLGLLYMLGFVNGKGNGVGEYEYSRMLRQETMKQHAKVISQSLKLDGGFNGPGVSSLHVSKVSKKVLRILGYLISVGAIRFGGGNVDQNEQNSGSNGRSSTDGGVPVQDEADEEEAGQMV